MRCKSKPLSAEDAQHLLEIRPRGAEVYYEGKFFMLNAKQTGYLAWSVPLQKWIMWLHKKPDPENSISIAELFDIAKRDQNASP